MSSETAVLGPTFLSVAMRAERLRGPTFKCVNVYVNVELAKRGEVAEIELHRLPSIEYSNGSALVVELTFSDASGWSEEDRVRLSQPASFSAEKGFSDALTRRYVVLMFRGHVVSVVDVES